MDMSVPCKSTLHETVMRSTPLKGPQDHSKGSLLNGIILKQTIKKDPS